MNWIDSHSRVEEGVTSVSCRMNRLLFADGLVLLASSQQGLQHALDRFSAACDRAKMKISAKNTEVLCQKQYMLQVSGIHWVGGEIQVHRGGIYQWRKAERGGVWIDKANAVLREFYQSLVTKRELSNTAKLSVFKSVFVPILTYDPESWVMTEIILSQG